MNNPLAAEALTPCKKDTPPLGSSDREELMQELPEWREIQQQDCPALQRSYTFKNFATALVFTNLVGELAEAEDHHPALLTEWGKVTVTWWTHSIGGLHHNDFVMAARSDEAYSVMQLNQA